MTKFFSSRELAVTELSEFGYSRTSSGRFIRKGHGFFATIHPCHNGVYVSYSRLKFA